MHAMLPRTKKGPSWKDDDPVPGPSTSPPVVERKSKKSKDASPRPQPESADEQDADRMPTSDSDWLKKHTKSTLDPIESEKVFEQSDDDSAEGDVEDGDDKVRSHGVVSDKHPRADMG